MVLRPDFTKRLEVVSARINGLQPPDGSGGLDPLTRLKLLVLAVYEGSLRPNESLMQGLARALGYVRMAEFNAALQEPGHHEFNERFSAAMRHLFSSRGLNLDTTTGKQIGEVMSVLVEGIDPSLFARAGLSPDGPSP